MRFITVAAVDAMVMYIMFFVVHWMDGSIQFSLLEMQRLTTGVYRIVIMLCNIVVLWFWVSMALNFNWLGAS